MEEKIAFYKALKMNSFLSLMNLFGIPPSKGLFPFKQTTCA